MTSYLSRLQAAQAAGVFPAGEVAQVDVEHGPGCDHHRNRRSPCTCYPAITALIGDELVSIGSGGVVLERRKRT
jgi:hypothetical protein